MIPKLAIGWHNMTTFTPLVPFILLACFFFVFFYTLYRVVNNDPMFKYSFLFNYIIQEYLNTTFTTTTTATNDNDNDNNDNINNTNYEHN